MDSSKILLQLLGFDVCRFRFSLKLILDRRLVSDSCDMGKRDVDSIDGGEEVEVWLLFFTPNFERNLYLSSPLSFLN